MKGVLSLFLKAKILFTGLGFFVRLATRPAAQCGNPTPGIKCFVSCRHFCCQIAVGKVQVPIRVFDIADKTPNTDFKVGQSDVAVDSSDHNSIHKTRRSIRSRDPIKLGACSLKQRVLGFHVDPSRESAWKLVPRRIVGIVLRVIL